MDRRKFGRPGVYPAQDGTLYVNFKKGDVGIPLESLYPPSSRGESFDNFPLKDYLSYASLCLATPKQFEMVREQCEQISLKAGEEVPLPDAATGYLDFAAYDLIQADGALDYAKIVELYAIVGDLWDHKPKPPNPEVGLLHGLVKANMPFEDIARAIILSAENKARGKDLQSSAGFQMFTPVFMSYRSARRVTEGILPQHMMQEIADVWMKWTRSVPVGHELFGDQQTVFMDYHQLGVFRADGSVDEQRTRQIADHIWANPNKKPSYLALLKWLRDTLNSTGSEADKQKLARVRKSQQSRKQAKVARKKGRKGKRK